ncbi:Zinc finger, BED-type [Phytophthora cactorum]|nr:Zinc finger, BED-type [Phytophthora cactorum]
MPSNEKSLSNKLVAALMFTKKSREEYVCSTCLKTCKSAHGYTNLITHLRSNHPTYLEDASQAVKDRNAPVSWCEWVVIDHLPLNFVERKMTRKNASLSQIIEKTLKSCLMRVFDDVESTLELSLVQQAFKKRKTSKRSLYNDMSSQRLERLTERTKDDTTVHFTKRDRA